MSSDSERYETLFSDGWREPSDGLERLSIYILATICAIGGLVLLLMTIFAPGRLLPVDEKLSHSGSQVLLAVFAITGGLMGLGGSTFLLKESKHWDTKLTLEKAVAGGILVGLAIMMIGFIALSHYRGEINPASGMALLTILLGCVALGGAVCLLSLVFGLLCAYAPILMPPHRLLDASIKCRYALDDKLDIVDDHPCPWEDGMIPVVEMTTAKGKAIKVRAQTFCYEQAEPGSVADAYIKQGRLVRLSRIRKHVALRRS